MIVRHTFLLTFTAFLLINCITLKTHSMELELSPHLIKYVRESNIIGLNQEFSAQKTDLYDGFTQDITHNNQLVKAIAFTENELESSKEYFKKHKRCFSRYKFALLPSLLVGYSVTNITISVLSYCQITSPNSVDITSLALNVVGSAIPGILFSGYEAIKYLRTGIADAHAKEQMRKLETSRIFLNSLLKR